MDNYACHNAHKITGQLTGANITSAPQPAHLPDLSPCPFWLFGLLKDTMKGTELTTEDHLLK
jgi:hypothetical protein